MRAVNLGLRFILELAALIALGYWGATQGTSHTEHLIYGWGAPIVVIIFWWMFIAPKSIVKMPFKTRTALSIIVFAGAAAALAVRDHVTLAIVLVAAAVLNTVMLLTDHGGKF